jgi:hypothetical protein
VKLPLLTSYLTNLGDLLLVVGISFFLGLLPFPPLFWMPTLPGAWLFYSGGGSALLCIGALLRLGCWVIRRRAARRIVLATGTQISVDTLRGRHV